MNKFPVIKITLFFVAGIIFQYTLNFRFEFLLILLLFLFAASVLLKKTGRERGNSIAQLMLIGAFCVSGASVYSVYQSGLKPYPFEKLKIQNCIAEGKITSIELPKEGRIIFTASIDSVRINSIPAAMEHSFIVRIYDGKPDKLLRLYDSLSIGARFRIEGSIQKAKDKRNPGEFDYNDYLFHAGISGLISVYEMEKFRLIRSNPESFKDLFRNYFHKSRNEIDRTIHKLHPGREAALLRGLLLGDYKLIDEESIENYVNAGVIHVLAVSGQHVALIILIFFFLFNRFNPYLKYIASAIGLIAFLYITGAQVSVERAVIMGLTFTGALLLNRDKNIYNILSISALIILILYPHELFSPGFQLSYSAVLSIVYIYPILKDFIYSFSIKSRMLRNTILFSAVSFSAQLGTLPFTLAYFNKLSFASLIANLAVIPLSGIIIYGGIITLFFYPFWHWGGEIFSYANGLQCRIISSLVDIFGGSGISFININQFSLYDSLVYYAGLAAVLFVLRRFNLLLPKGAAVLFIVLGVIAFVSFDDVKYWKPGELLVTAVDVGQGDATIIKFPDGKGALIDAGNANKYFSIGDKVILPLLNRLGIDSLNYLFITHLDADHLFGTFKLFEKVKIGTVFKPEPAAGDSADIKFEEYLSKNNYKIHHFVNEELNIGEARLYFLNHSSLYEGIKPGTNNKSMLLKLVYGNNSFLFTGDAGREVERRLAGYSASFLKSDILKAGHHGSRNSSDPTFINSVSPVRVIISCGIENRYNHPSPDVIGYFYQKNIEVLRTDKHGGIMLLSDGTKILNIDWKKRESRSIFDL